MAGDKMLEQTTKFRKASSDNIQKIESQTHCKELLSDNEEVNQLLANIGTSKGRKGSDASIASSQNTIVENPVKTSDNFTSIPYGFQLRATYEHGKENTDILGVVYNGRMRQFVILDARGITTWNRSVMNSKVSRDMSYPKYEYCVITDIIFARKYNCYFALGKDFSLKVLNKDFEETLSVSADLRSVLFMVFNPVTDQLITGGVGGTKIWEFHQVASGFKELRSMANYRLTLKMELADVGGSWVKRVELDQHLQHLYCCSDTDLYAYDLQGKLLFQFIRAHSMSITACKYSIGSRYLVTSSLDSEVKVWSRLGGLIHTFRGHSRAVTDTLIHPDSSFLIITSSLDGTVRVWSLETMDVLYSFVASVNGVIWMGLTDDNLLYLGTVSSLSVWSLNNVYSFWGLARNKVTQLCLAGGPSKTTRVMAIGDDGSVRLFVRSSQKNISTVLPPPSLSPLENILSVAYNREYNIIYLLMNPTEIWLYTTRTDPACRATVWSVSEIQKLSAHASHGLSLNQQSSTLSRGHKSRTIQRTSVNGSGNDPITDCSCLCSLAAAVMVWTEEGMSSLLQQSYLLLGLEDGRILFMDPVARGVKHMEFKVSKDKVLQIQHDQARQSVVTLCRQKECVSVQIWSLPQLQLQHEVFVTPNIRMITICGSALFCGHSNGCVARHELVRTEDLGLYTTKALPLLEELESVSRKSDHVSAVVALDCCPALSIVCSCSMDGVIKIWDSDKVLLTEICMGGVENTGDVILSSACFLNAQGDLLVGYLNHIFMIDHTKVYPSAKIPDVEKGYFDTESAVLEDTRVLYDDIQEEPEVITLQNYLVPFNIALSKDFLASGSNLAKFSQGKNEEEEEEESLSESGFGPSNAPSEIYLSPITSPRQLSAVDLLFGSGETEEEYLQRRVSATRRKLPKRGKKKSSRTGVTSDPEVTWVELPQFGTSPGPSPPPSESGTDTISPRRARKLADASAPHTQKPVKGQTKKTSDQESKGEPEAERKTEAGAEQNKILEVSKDEIAEVSQKDAKKPAVDPTLDKPKVKPTPSSPVHSPGRDRPPPLEPTPAPKVKVAREESPKVVSTKSKYSLDHIKIEVPKWAKAQPIPGKPAPFRPSAYTPNRKPVPPAEQSSKPVREIKKKQPSNVRRAVTKKSARRRSTARSEPEVSSPSPREDVTEDEAVSVLSTEFPGSSGILKHHVAESDIASSISESDIPSTIDHVDSVTKPCYVCEMTHAKSITSNTSEDNHGVQETEEVVLKSSQGLTEKQTDATEESSIRPIPEAVRPQATDMTEYPASDDLQYEADAPQFQCFLNVPGTNKPMYTRPRTAGQLSEEDSLWAAFEHTLNQYRRRPGTPSSSELWSKNSGIAFEDNWQDRMIERHQLLQLQKYLRAQSAAHNRNLVEQRQQEKRQSQPNHKQCDPSFRGDAGLDTSFHILEWFEKANRPPLTNQLTARNLRRPRTASAKLQGVDKTLLGAELPFRLRMNKSLSQNKLRNDAMDLSKCDPRNPKAVRPQSSKSIPGKCSKYILIQPPEEEGKIVASPMVEQLLRRRFPNQQLPVYNPPSGVSTDRSLMLASLLHHMS